MAVVSSVTDKGTVSSYPYIGKYKSDLNFFYVLFHQPNCGMIIYSENSERSVGYYDTAWCEEFFSITNDIIRMSNKI